MDIDLIEDKLYQAIGQFRETKITPVKFRLIRLNEIHPFYDGNSRKCETLFSKANKINSVYKTAILKSNTKEMEKSIFFLVVLIVVLKKL